MVALVNAVILVSLISWAWISNTREAGLWLVIYFVTLVSYYAGKSNAFDQRDQRRDVMADFNAFLTAQGLSASDLDRNRHDDLFKGFMAGWNAAEVAK